MIVDLHCPLSFERKKGNRYFSSFYQKMVQRQKRGLAHASFFPYSTIFLKGRFA
jgi:hypothetical protein